MIVPKLTNHLLLRKKWDLDTLPDKPRNHPVHQHWKVVPIVLDLDGTQPFLMFQSGLTGEAILTPNCIVNIEQTGGNDYWGMMNTHPINEILRFIDFHLKTRSTVTGANRTMNGKQ